MPEGRMIKKRISESKKLGALKSDSARLLYTWLIPHLDVEGRHKADPDLIRGHIFPKVKSMTPGKIMRLLNDLAEIELIVLYNSNGETYLQFEKFHDLQKIDRNREAQSDIPEPTANSRITLENSRVDHEDANTNKVKESKVELKHSTLFEEFWKSWPSERRDGKKNCRIKFLALCKRNQLNDFQKACQNYATELDYQKNQNNFEQTPKLTSTWMNNWEEWIDKKADGARSYD
jgi:hypothetical protein